MFDHILVVCTGNICRSPIAELLFRSKVKEAVQVESAGTGALIGHPADEFARAVLEDHGLDGTIHRARQVNRDLLRSAKLILVMENHHREEVQAADATARGKTFLLGHWLGQRPIADPYGCDKAAFQAAYIEIENAVDTWMEKL